MGVSLCFWFLLFFFPMFWSWESTFILKPTLIHLAEACHLLSSVSNATSNHLPITKQTISPSPHLPIPKDSCRFPPLNRGARTVGRCSAAASLHPLAALRARAPGASPPPTRRWAESPPSPRSSEAWGGGDDDDMYLKICIYGYI